MELPFTVAQFHALFGDYNRSVWPAQVIMTIFALGAIGLVFSRSRRSNSIISAVLAVLWFWLAAVYHLVFFSRINPAAYLFFGFSLVGGLAFIWHGVVRENLKFAWRQDWMGYAGVSLVAVALIVYPTLFLLGDTGYFDSPTFGLPCPTTLYTVGMLAFLSFPYPRSVAIVPVLWSLIGLQAAFLLEVPQDLMLLLAVALGVMVLVRGGSRPNG